MSAGPRITVVIPVRDEAARLAGCLGCIAAQDIDPAEVEILVVDGGSTDGTAELARRALAGHRWWRGEVLSSPGGDRPANLNAGLAAATAPLLVRVDGRSRIPPSYLRRCAALLESEPELSVVGGRQRAVAPGHRPFELGVARALNNRWGTGLARYRRSATSGPADTVYLGAYRTGQLRDAGGWRSDLPVNEDFDLNCRLRRQGTVWFDTGLTVDYLPRTSLGALLRQYWAFGTGKARYWRLSGDRPQPRQVAMVGAPLAAAAGLVATVLLVGPAAAAALAATGAAALAAVEALGAVGPRGGLRAHLTAAVVLSGIAAAWLAGVAAGTLAPAGRQQAAPAVRPARLSP